MTGYLSFIEFLKSKDIEYKENCVLAEYSSFKIGGNADIALFPDSIDKLIDAVHEMKKLRIKYTVIGNGTNVLFADSGYRGAIVFTTEMKSCTVTGNMISCESGHSFTGLALTAQKNSLSGLEFAYGIPGTVGGAVFMNAGAYGGETAYVLEESTYYDPATNTISRLYGCEHKFGYRHSVYMEKDVIILRALFRLKHGDPDTIKEKMDTLMQKRRDKQPLEYPSAGSAFKRYPGYYTAQLIDELGLKGYSIGGAQVSEKHAGFIINKGGATSHDVLELIGYIKDRIYEKYAIAIEPEIRFIK